MSLSKELFVANSLNTCDTAVSSFHNVEDDPLHKDSLLSQLAEFTLTNMMLNSSNAIESRVENNILVKTSSETINATGDDTQAKQVMRNRIQSKVFNCGVCSKEFSQHYKLIRHLYIHSDKRNYKCAICGKAFRQMSTLCQHRAIHSMAKPHSCSVCNKSFNRVSTLISHRKIHDGEKSHQCPHCPKAFHQKANLRHHIFTHTNERPYKCDICPKGFNQLSNLTCHKLKSHCHNTSVQRYECHICSKSFVKRANCRNHELHEHGNIIAEIMKRPSKAGDEPTLKPTDGDRDNIPNLPPNTIKILVDPINTVAMRLARELNQPLLVLLKPLDSVPVVVRVYEAGAKQMLVPVTWTDLCRYSQIVNTKEFERQQANPNATEKFKLQIKIPIVATMQEFRTAADLRNLPKLLPKPTVIVTNGENATRTLKEDLQTSVTSKTK